MGWMYALVREMNTRLSSTVAEAEQVKQSLTQQGYEHVTVVANEHIAVDRQGV